MLKHIVILITLFVSASAVGQIDSIGKVNDALQFQKELNEEYKNPKKSPLDAKALKKFKSHQFFPINLHYRVEAKFIRTADEQTFGMVTTTDRRPEYVKYGEVHFTLDGKKCRLNVYQAIGLSATEEYKDYLFLPFTDLTNGNETYDGGRFIDLRVPSADTLVVDFNKAYNPFCVYSHLYSCPIPPKENNLDVAILAGVKKPKK